VHGARRARASGRCKDTRAAHTACSRRHPESGYVQGMNDLVTPFYTVFLSEHLAGPMEAWQPDLLPMVSGSTTH